MIPSPSPNGSNTRRASDIGSPLPSLLGSKRRRQGGLGRKGQPSACVARSGEDNPEKASRGLRVEERKSGKRDLFYSQSF